MYPVITRTAVTQTADQYGQEGGRPGEDAELDAVDECRRQSEDAAHAANVHPNRRQPRGKVRPRAHRPVTEDVVVLGRDNHAREIDEQQHHRVRSGVGREQ